MRFRRLRRYGEPDEVFQEPEPATVFAEDDSGSQPEVVEVDPGAEPAGEFSWAEVNEEELTEEVEEEAGNVTDGPGKETVGLEFTADTTYPDGDDEEVTDQQHIEATPSSMFPGGEETEEATGEDARDTGYAFLQPSVKPVPGSGRPNIIFKYS